MKAAIAITARRKRSAWSSGLRAFFSCYERIPSDDGFTVDAVQQTQAKGTIGRSITAAGARSSGEHLPMYTLQSIESGKKFVFVSDSVRGVLSMQGADTPFVEELDSLIAHYKICIEQQQVHANVHRIAPRWQQRSLATASGSRAKIRNSATNRPNRSPCTSFPLSMSSRRRPCRNAT